MNEFSSKQPAKIQAMFSQIAERYDFANAALSFHLHKYWNRKLAQTVLVPSRVKTFLDLCAGTGEIAFCALKDKRAPSQAYLLDFCEEMLACAKKKAFSLSLERHCIDYIHGDAQAIPLSNASVDAVSIAYGIRNVCNPDLCLEEIARVLKPGGMVGILELTEPTSFLLKQGHRFYLKRILPWLGKALTSQRTAYEYLCESISSFIKPQELAGKLTQARFQEIRVTPLCGGVASLLTAKRE